jgi:hypothetical protein
MEDDEELTTVQIKKGTLRKLGIVAKGNRRTKAAQVEHMTDLAYEELEQMGRLPKEEDLPMPAIDDVA